MNLSERNLSPTTRNYPKLTLFAIMGLMTLLVFGYEVYLALYVPASLTRLLSMKWLLFPHILFATTAFVVGPFQFSTRLRRRKMALHRRLGKAYVFSILFAAPFAFAITCVYPPKNINFLIENLVQATIWLLTTVVAWLAVRNKQIELHKIWMARSYGVTFIFVLSRVFAPLPFMRQMSAESAVSFFWFLIVFALLVPELLLNGTVLITGHPRKTLSRSRTPETARI
ncbi:DUF2306 domain-containing protein [Spirosoma rhododendri]|uniref:DUF2306 domain-containing protein n=1 Tax=Spirosoma rhododendri TaxID=2728024 RepID=A0A7L5DYN8_9BACT|nr:DUF2306 domain-containing protein [Spirosoma rhododendri]QJD80630.1 DUF2306 domain-containing protein [Spirosoma rhododendri]